MTAGTETQGGVGVSYLIWPTLWSKLVYNAHVRISPWRWLPEVQWGGDTHFGNYWYVTWLRWMWFGGRAHINPLYPKAPPHD